MPQKQREDLGDEDQAIYGLGETRDYWYKSTLVTAFATL